MVGRRAELAQLQDLMARSRLVSLVWVGGVGKTTSPFTPPQGSASVVFARARSRRPPHDGTRGPTRAAIAAGRPAHVNQPALRPAHSILIHRLLNACLAHCHRRTASALGLCDAAPEVKSAVVVAPAMRSQRRWRVVEDSQQFTRLTRPDDPDPMAHIGWRVLTLHGRRRFTAMSLAAIPIGLEHGI